MDCEVLLSHEEYELRVLLAKMENRCIDQRIKFIGDPWIILQKAEELNRIINQVPKPNHRINQYEGD
jgi:hypothetical protein